MISVSPADGNGRLIDAEIVGRLLSGQVLTQNQIVSLPKGRLRIPVFIACPSLKDAFYMISKETRIEIQAPSARRHSHLLEDLFRRTGRLSVVERIFQTITEKISLWKSYAESQVSRPAFMWVKGLSGSGKSFIM